ncbi:hypothetical protein L1N85_15650 [Paenibacillus alkaliterrae]|uniref:hypothetical protein n=1 Tax=Paenibacillus alkaliterrae TaxID=320909 RepID=UPI001F45F321|nr:hypothetical protein [Paenibacillus alkaliterrae]MCF2939854.1 hypothetical protein [Paenibacillus alkaliterrae]
MNLTGKEASKTALLAAASALVILAAGCQSAATTPEDPLTSSLGAGHNQTDNEPDSPQKTYSEQNDDERATEEPHTNRADTTSDTSAETSTLNKPEDTKATVETESEKSSWSSSDPKLHEIAIGDAVSKVSKLFGKEIDSYTLEEETGAIQVLEYDGFAIGINGGKTVQFVEVYGEHVSSGLSGLRIGDKPEAALRLLGKPHKQTTYLLTYEAENALLKLDLDPAHNTIVSIKLLSLS